MGLDMYLTKRHYVKRWDHTPEDKRCVVTVTKGGKPHPNIKPERVSYVHEQVHYWRKANQIHAWFVREVQEGEDDCGHYYVPIRKLRELKALCDKVIEASEMVPAAVHVSTVSEAGAPWKKIYEPGEAIADTKVARELLPSKSGFFFGGTDYNQYYMQDVRDTADMLVDLLAEVDACNHGKGDDGEYADFDVYYHSSW